MEELYKDDNIRVDCRSSKEYIDSLSETNEPIFTRIL